MYDYFFSIMFSLVDSMSLNTQYHRINNPVTVYVLMLNTLTKTCGEVKNQLLSPNILPDNMGIILQPFDKSH